MKATEEKKERRYFKGRLSRKQYITLITILSIIAFFLLCLLLLYTVRTFVSNSQPHSPGNIPNPHPKDILGSHIRRKLERDNFIRFHALLSRRGWIHITVGFAVKEASIAGFMGVCGTSAIDVYILHAREPTGHV